MLSVRALLCALLLLGVDDRALHLSAATEVLFCRLSNASKAHLDVVGRADDQQCFLARYRQVRYLFHALSSVLDPSGLVKNQRINVDEFARRCVVLEDDEARDARTRLEAFMGQLLAASVAQCERPPHLAYGLDATPVPLFSRGPSKRSGLCATDPDGGWYVREGDHREREDHQGRRRSRVAWALEATVLTSASSEPGRLSSFPNLVVGLALERPGVDPGGTALRVLRGARERGFSPGPLGVDRAYSGAFAETFHLPVRALGFSLVVDYRVEQLGRQANSHGAVLVEGTWYCPAMPEVLVSATRDLRAATIDADIYRARSGARRAQSFAYGSEEWARHYATLRNTIEGWNGFVKDTAHEALAQPARRRVRGIAAQGVFITLLFVAANLRKIEAHQQQMAKRDAIEARKRVRRRRVSLKDYLAS